ncbi:MAG: cyclodeaminase/cyclohydrolase family protein [Synergistales bacterium]|nr:cyclodeaminase/cyclohydrolase family protein [Synergistales bacterium]MDY6401375.1 cyclodeaminase/cyclohydrolase family protein [Synergistales bacterium]MDY6405050.1 cyclodeaminase/cyclohydrolase family protein [Synergistales bacterium]MDY6410121.1 cyclodeaminase/cyclohydrolase family protein [Synergistales bacterium]MDY6413909.1 cyclodeaminase/cyclohydrolase family protein [Synergistales bacterium]
MKNILTHESCENFSELLAAKISVPGGGGAAALVGALGAALCSMAGNFTLGKKKYAEFEEDIKKILTKAEKIRLRLLELVNEDAEAFTPLAEAYAIPKDDPERGEILEKALLNACKAPLEMIEQCAEVINLLEEMLTKGSRLLISDVGCGALLSRAAMESAAVNVFINTSSLKNRDEAISIEAKTDKMLNEFCPKASKIADEVNKIIRGN